jgi:hypothetical protein
MLETGNSLLFDGDYSGAPSAPYYPQAAPTYGAPMQQQPYMGGGQNRYGQGGGAYEQPSYY